MKDLWPRVDNRRIFMWIILLHVFKVAFSVPRGVITDPSIRVHVGSETRLQCTNNTTDTIISVTWGTGTKPSTPTIILQKTEDHDDAPNTRNHRFTVDVDYSLIISETSIDDSGPYWCQMSYLGHGNYYNTTTLHVYRRVTTLPPGNKPPDGTGGERPKPIAGNSASSGTLTTTTNTNAVVVNMLFTLGLVTRHLR